MADDADKINPDIDFQLAKRMNTMLDAIEASRDAKAIAAGFRTLVEFSRPKPPQVLDLGGISLNVSGIHGDKDAGG